MHTWENLVSALRGDQFGYRGDGEYKSVTAYLKKENIEVKGVSDRDIAEMWNDHCDANGIKGKSVRIDVTSDGGEEIELNRFDMNDEDDEKRKKGEDEDDKEDEAKSFASAIIAEMRRSNDAHRKSVDVKVGRNRLADDPCLGYPDVKKGGMGFYFADVMRASRGGRIPERLSKALTAHQENVDMQAKSFGWKSPSGMNEGIDSEGGFAVPTFFREELLRDFYDNSQLVSRARSMPMMSRTMTIPALDQSSRKDGEQDGGVQAFWEGEGAEITTTKMKFENVNLVAHKLTAGAEATNELIEDASWVMPEIIVERFSRALQWKVQNSFVRGTGAGQPLGILNAPATVVVPKESMQDDATVVTANIDKMWARLPAWSKMNAVWFINVEVDPELSNLVQEVGTGGVALYRPPGGLSDSPFGTLKGRPVIPIEQCSALGDVGDIMLVDMSEYIDASRRDMRFEESMHVRFLQDEMTYRFTMRRDGQPWRKSPITPSFGTNTLSPFVVLAERSS